MSIVTVETQCRSCGAEQLETLIAFGDTPLADRLVHPDQADQPQPSAPLTLARCGSCGLAQILETVDPEVLFYAEYPYFSSVSPRLIAHFRASAESIMDRYGPDDAFVVEAASNDGCMLVNFADAGHRVLGIDPSKAPADAAIERGVPTVIDFFGADLARRLVDEHGAADVFLGNNVLAHVMDLNGFVEGMAAMLTDTGVAVIEWPYMVDLIDHVEFDTIYHQHLCYFTIGALIPLFERHGLSLNDVERTDIHGGSLRLFIQKTPNRGASVDALLAMEAERGFESGDAYRDFADRIAALRAELRSIIDQLQAEGARVAGYAAAAKATTMLAYTGIGAETLDYICDLSTHKQGRLMTGNLIPIGQALYPN